MTQSKTNTDVHNPQKAEIHEYFSTEEPEFQIDLFSFVFLKKAANTLAEGVS